MSYSNGQSARAASLERRTRETGVSVSLSLEPGTVEVSTGIGFLDHLVSSLALHAGFSLSLTCAGDLVVDDHHSAEDCALALGQALGAALGDKAGIARFGYAYAPLDEALARAVVDLSGRPWASVRLKLRREALGGLACENVGHFLTSLAIAARMTLHVDALRGGNDHHKAEAAFKALALALKAAVALDPARAGAVPSAKGVL